MNTLIQILTVLVGVLTGGGIVRMFTIRAERNKILGEGEVAQANAAKTYHEISMEMIQEARTQVTEMRADMRDLQGSLDEAQKEVSSLRAKVRELSDQLDEKDRIIKEKDRELAALKGGKL